MDNCFSLREDFQYLLFLLLQYHWNKDSIYSQNNTISALKMAFFGLCHSECVWFVVTDESVLLKYLVQIIWEVKHIRSVFSRRFIFTLWGGIK